MEGRNSQSSMRTRLHNNCSLRAIKVVISTQKRHRKAKISQPEAGAESFNEMNSNSDTCCLGSNFIVIGITERTANVYFYDTSYTPIENVLIMSGATIYTDEKTDNSFILVIHEALYYGNNLGHLLINPNQMRQFGTMI